MIKKLFIFLTIFTYSVLFSQIDTVKVIQLTDISITSTRTKVESIPSTVIKMDSIKNYFGQETPSFFGNTTSVITQSDNGTPFGYSYLSLRGMGQNRINYTF